MTTLTWLHLSDLHVNGKEGTRERLLFEGMLKDIQEQIRLEKLSLDVIFFTGDLAFSGKPDQFKLAATMLDEILDACSMVKRRDRVFLVPGNHDVDRDAIRPGQQEYFHSLLDLQDEAHDRDKYARVNTFLGDADERARFFAPLGNFWQFTQEFYGDPKLVLTHNDYYSVRTIDKDDRTIVVLGLNSAWLSFKDHIKHQGSRQGELLLGEQQVCDAQKKALHLGPEASLFIALVHHPIYWLAEQDMHRVQQHLPEVCDLLLRGHLHCPSYSTLSTPDWHMHEFAAGASWNEPWHAYNLVKLDLSSGVGSAIVRFRDPERTVEWRPDVLTYRNARSGRIRWKVRLRR